MKTIATAAFTILILIGTFSFGLAMTLDQAMEAAGKGNIITLKKFKKEKGDLNAQDSHGLTPLMRAIATGQTKAVDYLLAQKVNLELKNENGDTALAMALGNDKDQIAVSLINAGAKTDILGGDAKNSPTFMAASSNSIKALELLLKKSPDQLNLKNKNGDTPLHEAARYGSEKTLQILLKAGADKGLKNNEGKTPLDVASSIQNQAAVKLLK